MDHPQGGRIKLQTPWIRMSRTPARIEHMAPRAGAHTQEVLQDICGLTTSQVSALRARGVVS
jgi:crotonobetainyl-CoA:carnitine CoA-transferase CaiB-like acyl-CoA transferase